MYLYTYIKKINEYFKLNEKFKKKNLHEMVNILLSTSELFLSCFLYTEVKIQCALIFILFL